MESSNQQLTVNFRATRLAPLTDFFVQPSEFLCRAGFLCKAGENHMRTIFGSGILWIGVALLAIIMYLGWRGVTDPGWGMLAGLAFWPSLCLFAIGLVVGIARYRNR